MVIETVAGWPGWFEWLNLLLLGLIVLFEYVDWSFDKDIELLKEQNRILKGGFEQQQKILEKMEQRLEQLYIEQVKK